jgi:hypothetical protein
MINGGDGPLQFRGAMAAEIGVGNEETQLARKKNAFCKVMGS